MTVGTRLALAVLTAFIVYAAGLLVMPASVAPWVGLAAAAVLWIATKPRAGRAAGAGMSQAARTRIAIAVLVVGGLATVAIIADHLLSVS